MYSAFLSPKVSSWDKSFLTLFSNLNEISILGSLICGLLQLMISIAVLIEFKRKCQTKLVQRLVIQVYRLLSFRIHTTFCKLISILLPKTAEQQIFLPWVTLRSLACQGNVLNSALKRSKIKAGQDPFKPI